MYDFILRLKLLTVLQYQLYHHFYIFHIIHIIPTHLLIYHTVIPQLASKLRPHQREGIYIIRAIISHICTYSIRH